MMRFIFTRTFNWLDLLLIGVASDLLRDGYSWWVSLLVIIVGSALSVGAEMLFTEQHA